MPLLTVLRKKINANNISRLCIQGSVNIHLKRRCLAINKDTKKRCTRTLHLGKQSSFSANNTSTDGTLKILSSIGTPFSFPPAAFKPLRDIAVENIILKISHLSLNFVNNSIDSYYQTLIDSLNFLGKHFFSNSNEFHFVSSDISGYFLNTFKISVLHVFLWLVILHRFSRPWHVRPVLWAPKGPLNWATPFPSCLLATTVQVQCKSNQLR